MELIYSASISGKLRRDWVQEESPICSLSSRNIIAIASSSICASSCERRLSAPLEMIYEVCVCDIDRPWELHHVTSDMDKIVALEWHQSGTKLLIATSFGKCQVWEMKDYLLNEWKCVQQNNIIGEEIISISWLHDGMKMVFNSDKKDSVLYSEKVARLKFAPSLSHFGGKPVTGWLAVTATGLVCVTVFETDSIEGAMQIASLMTTRSRVLLADIAHDTNGSLLLVTSDGNISSAVQCYRVSLTIDPTKTQPCLINCRPIASFYVNCHIDPILRSSPTACITHVRYMLKESGDTVIVGAGDIDSSHVELWNLMTESVPLHRLYQTVETADSVNQIHKWMYKSSISHISLPVAIAVPQFPVRSTGGAPTLFQYVAIGYQDGSVKLVNKHTFQPMTTTNLDMGITECDGDGEKVPKMVAHMADMKQTVTGAVLVGIDQYSCVYVMKAANTRDPVSQVPPQYLVAMLEYLITAGYDWWDIQAAVRPGVVDAVIQKLRDNFCQQPVITQQLLLPRFLAVKASLYRCSTTGQQRSVDCLCRLLVHSISTLFRSLLRPKAITAAEKSPAEKLTQSCANIAETDIDKFVAVSGLDRREYHVDSATLQCLHELIQWLADLSLYLLASLPLAHGYGNSFSFPGLSLLHDVPVLACLRELLVIVRMWGAVNPGCLPQFTCTCANFDCLALLFKLLTEVWLVSREGATGRLSYDDSLLDDCCLLQSQVRVPTADQGMFGQLDYSAVILSQQHPITFTFGEAPRQMSKGVVLPSVMPERQPQCRQKRDVIRQLTLGVNGSEPTKTCSRCSSMSLAHDSTKTATFKSATMNMWDRQWARYCLCGGHWKLDKC